VLAVRLGEPAIGGRSYKLARSQTAQASRQVRLKLRLTRRATRALRRAVRRGGQYRVRISLRARGAAGNRSSLVRATVRAVR
jgi:hypothetical protein